MMYNKYKQKIIAVIPAYNEEKNIMKVIKETKKYVNLIIVGDDGSNDATAKVATAMGAIVIRNRINQGKGYTLRRLFIAALKMGADIVVTLDADGQHDPKYIPKLIELINKNGADIVIGSRFINKKSINKIPAYRRIGLNLINIINKLFFKNIQDTQSGYRAYSRKAIEILVKNMRERGYGTETEQLYLAKKYRLNIVEVPITIIYNVKKPNKKNPLSHGIEIMLVTLKILIYNLLKK